MLPPVLFQLSALGIWDGSQESVFSLKHHPGKLWLEVCSKGQFCLVASIPVKYGPFNMELQSSLVKYALLVRMCQHLLGYLLLQVVFWINLKVTENKQLMSLSTFSSEISHGPGVQATNRLWLNEALEASIDKQSKDWMYMQPRPGTLSFQTFLNFSTFDHLFFFSFRFI